MLVGSLLAISNFNQTDKLLNSCWHLIYSSSPNVLNRISFKVQEFSFSLNFLYMHASIDVIDHLKQNESAAIIKLKKKRI